MSAVIVERKYIEPVCDPLGCQTDLPLSQTIYPLGFPARINTNSTAILRAADVSFGLFPPVFSVPPIHLSIGVSYSADDRLPAPPSFRAREHLMSVVSDADNSLTCDFRFGFAFGWVNSSVEREESFLRYFFLDAALLSMVNDLYLAPVHGALVQHNGQGFLLCGESGAGKSTLAFACASRGWTFISDDATYLVRSRPDRMGIGNPYTLRFREDAPSLFPQLSGRQSRLLANGKFTIEARTDQFARITTSAGCRIDHVVFLDRHHPGAHSIRTFCRHIALERLAGVITSGRESVRNEQLNTFHRLRAAAFWEMRYRDLNQAVSTLESLTALQERD